MYKSIVAAGFIAVAGLATYAVAAPKTTSSHFSGEKLAKNAKVSIDSAQAIALKARPGEITDRELEKEQGGTGLRYSFDIKSDGKTYEVGVDANTGAVLENATEGKNPD